MSAEIDQLYSKIEVADGFDRIAPLEDILNNAQKSGNLQELPETAEGFQQNPKLLSMMRARLNHLGYLAKPGKSAKITSNDEKAIRRFQKEAGITVDGWVGKESWQVMQDLFSFEADSHLERWTSEEQYLPLLNRAVQLRLFAFSLLKTSPREKLIDPLPGLRKFNKLAVLIGLTDTQLKAGYSFETLNLLFDQNRITRRIANLSPKIDPKRDKVFSGFVVCNAKIELWLLGYPIVPDGKAEESRKLPRRARGSKAIRKHISSYSSFANVLRMFCDDVNPDRESELQAGKFDSQYRKVFQEFLEANIATAAESEAIDPEVLVSTIKQYPEEAQEEWNNQQSFIGRLWDGVKRAWGWIKRLLRKALQVVTTLVRNAIRVVWSLAIHSIGIIKAAINSFPDAVRFFIRSEVKGSNKNAVVFHHDTDFDWRVYVAPNPASGAVDEVLDELGDQLKKFTFSVRLVGLLISSLVGSIRIPIAGYLTLFLALSRIRPQLDEFLDYFEENKSILIA